MIFTNGCEPTVPRLLIRTRKPGLKMKCAPEIGIIPGR